MPLGEYEELTQRGVPGTGTENYGKPVVTAGGLLFITATADAKIRAFDKDNGKVLWEHELPAEGHATPSVYAVNGKQYLAISVGGSKLKPHPFDFRFISQRMFFAGLIKFYAAFVKKIENFGNFIGSQSDVSIVSFLIIKPFDRKPWHFLSFFCLFNKSLI